MKHNKNKSAHFVALLSLVGISFSAPLGMLAINMGAQPVAVGIWRMAFSVPVMMIIWLISLSKNKDKPKEDVPRGYKNITMLSGVFLALHFMCWYFALANTTVFNAAALVSLQPIYAMLGMFFVFKEKPARSVIIPLAVALVGSFVLISPSIASSGDTSFFGNIIAALSGIFMAGYLMCGRYALRRISLGGYTTVAYGVCFVLMVLVALIFNINMAVSQEIIRVLLMLAIAATLFGHSLLNWSLPHVGAFFATVVLLGEPVGATIAAYFMFDTLPGWVEVAGGVMIICGIAMLIMRANRQTALASQTD